MQWFKREEKMSPTRKSPYVIYKCAYCPATDETEQLELVHFAKPSEERTLKEQKEGIYNLGHCCKNCFSWASTIAYDLLGHKK